MPKKIKNCFYEKLTFEKFIQAHKRAKKNKTYKDEVIRYEMNLENNIINLINQIKNGTYSLGEYFAFKVYEPKERTIQALPYRDRIVHQWYIEEFIKPNILPKFISTSFACISDKGTHKAVDQIQKYMQIYNRTNPEFWILKCDIKKFFYTIDPVILFNIMKKYINDKALLNFTKILIFSKRYKIGDIGIPIRKLHKSIFR